MLCWYESWDIVPRIEATSDSRQRNLLDKVSSSTNPRWELFWGLYFVFTLDQLDFISDYTMAWSLETNINSELVIFLNNGRPFVVPCSSTAEDKDLLQQMRMFYNLQRIRYGLFELIGVKSVQRIDVVKVSL
jgi:hypothetical protein